MRGSWVCPLAGHPSTVIAHAIASIPVCVGSPTDGIRLTAKPNLKRYRICKARPSKLSAVFEADPAACFPPCYSSALWASRQPA